MGCWNGTCGISNLPIKAGEKIVVIPLVKSIREINTHCCNATDNYSPIGFPVTGKYDDYGGIEYTETFSENEEFFFSLEFYIKENDEYKLLEGFEDIDDLFAKTFCSYDEVFVKINDTRMAKVDFMMIHYGLYRDIIKEMSNRKPYGKELTYATCQKKRILNSVSKSKKEISDFIKLKAEALEKGKHIKEEMDEIFLLNMMNTLSYECFLSEVTLNCGKMNFFAEKLLSNSSSKIVNEMVNQFVFITALNYIRKGFLCECGSGAQCEETRLHVVIAEFVLRHVQ